jgi:tetratricopeptide (TPR) repeat protein
MIDINVYFPSLGVIGAVLLGVLLWKPTAAAQPWAKTGTLGAVCFSLIVLIFSGFAMVSTELQYRAQGEADENRFQDAANTLELATKLMPLNSSLFHDSGDINLNLYHKKHDIRRLEIATASFRNAIALSPYKSGPHIGLGLCLSSANRVEDALEEIRIAQRLAPDATNAYAIARLLEKRLGIAQTPR